MAKIFKYAIEPKPELQRISVPYGARLLSAIEQNGDVFLYAMTFPLSRPDTVLVERKIYCVGTGWDFDMNKLFVNHFIDTVKAGPYVWHVFEVEDLPF